MEQFSDVTDAYERKVNAIALEVMNEIYARLPYGQEFKLSDGSICKMKKFVAPEIKPEESPNYPNTPCFAFDIIITGGKLDHLEFYCYQTGGGGFMTPSPVNGDKDG